MVETYDLEGVGDNAGGHELLSVVAAVHHERVGQTLDDGALSLAEALGSIAAGSVGEVDRGADLDVVAVKSRLALPVLIDKTFCMQSVVGARTAWFAHFEICGFSFNAGKKSYAKSNEPLDMLKHRPRTQSHDFRAPKSLAPD